jgi:hypothetical protein
MVNDITGLVSLSDFMTHDLLASRGLPTMMENSALHGQKWCQ